MFSSMFSRLPQTKKLTGCKILSGVGSSSQSSGAAHSSGACSSGAFSSGAGRRLLFHKQHHAHRHPTWRATFAAHWVENATSGLGLFVPCKLLKSAKKIIVGFPGTNLPPLGALKTRSCLFKSLSFWPISAYSTSVQHVYVYFSKCIYLYIYIYDYMCSMAYF